MAHAYTPGLRITAHTQLRKERRLPLKGEVLVAVGDRVHRDQVVARTDLPGDVVTVNVVNRLGISADDIGQYMLKKEGDPVAAGEPIAETRPWIKWLKTVVESGIDGTLENISSITGQVILRKPPAPVEMPAYIDGTVVGVIPGEGVVVETAGAFVQGIFGVGGENWGTLDLRVSDPSQPLTPALLGSDCEGKIVGGGGRLSYEAILAARDMGAVGIIGAGIHDRDLCELLGYDLGVAITGTEEIGITLIITEGFGEIAMARKTFSILERFSGREASLSGATQIRAGVLRPELIVPDLDAPEAKSEAHSSVSGMQVGDVLRVIRAPHFGRIGQIAELNTELRKVESGAHVRVLEVKFEDGSRVVVPRANVELIEE
ncbi:MAG: hypothetical protein VX733_03590 [Candidatus Latescibacterota bacterium]|nr:hypothetical protein [Candidatus Latescibacterota bacterium]